MRARLSFQLVAVTLAAVAAAWFWALTPMTASLLYIHSSGWTDADLVRHLWHVRLVQPEWVSSPPHYDYLRWTQAEALARLAVVFTVWLAGAAWIARRHLTRRTVNPPNKRAPGKGGFARRFYIGSLAPALPEHERSASHERGTTSAGSRA